MAKVIIQLGNDISTDDIYPGAGDGARRRRRLT